MGLSSSVLASPKTDMQMKERNARPVATQTVTVVVKKAAPENLAASPRVAKMYADRTQISVPGVEQPSTTAPAYATVSAPPKVQQQMAERARTFEIAPVK